MSARFEVVRTDAGHHARFVAANGQTVWVTESYTRRRAAWNAIRVIESAVGASGEPIELQEIDERTKP